MRYLRYGSALVLAVGVAGVSCVAMEEAAAIEQEVLGPPAMVSVSPTTSDRVTVSWTAVAGAVKYYVFQSTGPAGPFVYINTTRAPGTSLQVANLTPGTEYCFEVRTEDGTGPGAASSPPACTNTPTGPQPPSSVLATQTAETAIRVDWSAVTGATKYYIYQSTGMAGPFNYVGTTLAPSTAFNATNLMAMTTYCFTVAVETVNGVSAQSAASCNSGLQPPSNVTATAISATRIRVDWTKATGATKYYIYESAGGGPLTFRGSVLDSSPPTYTAAGLTTGVEYCYQLRSQGTPASNVSGYSLPPACTTPGT